MNEYTLISILKSNQEGSSVEKTVVPSRRPVIPDIFHPLTKISFTFSDVN